MSDLKKLRIKTVLKYTWPFYIIATFLIALGMYFIFGVTHRTPEYKTLTLFVSGQIKDNNQLRDDMLNKYKEKEIINFSCIVADPSDSNYYSKLSIPGYNSADVLVIPSSVAKGLNVSAFALELNEELINDYCSTYSLYQQEGTSYGIKLNKEKASEYFYLPSEECYMFLNGNSVNTGKYSKEAISSHNVALEFVKDWGAK